MFIIKKFSNVQIVVKRGLQYYSANEEGQTKKEKEKREREKERKLRTHYSICWLDFFSLRYLIRRCFLILQRSDPSSLQRILHQAKGLAQSFRQAKSAESTVSQIFLVSTERKQKGKNRCYLYVFHCSQNAEGNRKLRFSVDENKAFGFPKAVFFLVFVFG